MQDELRHKQKREKLYVFSTFDMQLSYSCIYDRRFKCKRGALRGAACEKGGEEGTQRPETARTSDLEFGVLRTKVHW